MAVINIYEPAEAQGRILRRRRWEDQEMPRRCWRHRAHLRRRLAPAEAVERILPTSAGAATRPSPNGRRASRASEMAGRRSPASRRARDSGRRMADGVCRAAGRGTGGAGPGAARVEAFHRKQPMDSWVDAGPDGTLGQLIRPIERAGVYVPGGTAPLPSSLLMAAIPARVAGVREVIVCTPPGRDGARARPDPGRRLPGRRRPAVCPGWGAGHRRAWRMARRRCRPSTRSWAPAACS